MRFIYTYRTFCAQKVLFLFLFVFFINRGKSQTIDSHHSDTLKLKVSLITPIEESSLPPYCGIFAWMEPYEFYVERVLQGTYDKDRIEILIRCPRGRYERGELRSGKAIVYTIIYDVEKDIFISSL